MIQDKVYWTTLDHDHTGSAGRTGRDFISESNYVKKSSLDQWATIKLNEYSEYKVKLLKSNITKARRNISSNENRNMIFLQTVVAVMAILEVHGMVHLKGSNEEHRFKRADRLDNLCTIHRRQSSARELDENLEADNDGSIEGEFMLTNGQKNHKESAEEAGESVVTSREIITASFIKTWPGPQIPCQVNEDGFSAAELSVIESALKHIMKYSCVQFEPKERGNKDRSITFLKSSDKEGDSSDLGRNTVGNFISIAQGYKIGDVVHEILHAFGFIHEHARSDRNDYVRINWDNIRNGQDRQFQMGKERDFGRDPITGKTRKYKGEQHGVKYDFNSVMHYGRYQGSIEKPGPGKRGKETISLVPEWQRKCEAAGVRCNVGQRIGMSQRDAYQLNKVFRCPTQRPTGSNELVESWPPCRGSSCVIL